MNYQREKIRKQSHNCIKKYLRTNLTKDVKDLYLENYKTLKKEIEDRNKWKHILCSWIGSINIIKMLILPKTIYRFNTIPIRVPRVYISNIELTFQKFIWNHKRPHTVTIIQRKNIKVGRIILPNIKLYYKTTVIKTSWYWHKNRHIDQWNRIDSTEINPTLFGQLVFEKGGEA